MYSYTSRNLLYRNYWETFKSPLPFTANLTRIPYYVDSINTNTKSYRYIYRLLFHLKFHIVVLNARLNKRNLNLP